MLLRVVGVVVVVVVRNEEKEEEEEVVIVVVSVSSGLRREGMGIEILRGLGLQGVKRDISAVRPGTDDGRVKCATLLSASFL